MMLILALWVLVGAGVGFALGSARGEGGLGSFLGGVLGPVGWLIMVLRAQHFRCPHCQKSLHEKATVCPYCQREVK